MVLRLLAAEECRKRRAISSTACSFGVSSLHQRAAAVAVRQVLINIAQRDDGELAQNIDFAVVVLSRAETGMSDVWSKWP